MIPKIIHYCWFGGGPIPERDKKCIESWKRFCPDYEIIRWDETNYDVTKNTYMKQAYDAKKWGFVPDYARLDIVHEYGGIYLDTDVELIKNIDFLLAHSGFAGYENPQYIALGLGFGAEKNNHVIYKMMQEYNDVEFINDDGTFNLLPSPSYSTKSLKDCGFNLNGSLSYKDNFYLYPKDYFCPRDYTTGTCNITTNTCSIHWFNASWQTKHQKRMLKIRRLIGDKLYFKLVDVKNTLLGKGKKNYE